MQAYSDNAIRKRWRVHHAPSPSLTLQNGREHGSERRNATSIELWSKIAHKGRLQLGPLGASLTTHRRALPFPDPWQPLGNTVKQKDASAKIAGVMRKVLRTLPARHEAVDRLAGLTDLTIDRPVEHGLRNSCRSLTSISCKRPALTEKEIFPAGAAIRATKNLHGCDHHLNRDTGCDLAVKEVPALSTPHLTGRCLNAHSSPVIALRLNEKVAFGSIERCVAQSSLPTDAVCNGTDQLGYPLLDAIPPCLSSGVDGAVDLIPSTMLGTTPFRCC